MKSHGVLLFFVAANPDCTMRQMSAALGVTHRRVEQVIRELAGAGLVNVTKVGRQNSYSVNRQASFDHPTLSHITLGRFEQVLLSDHRTDSRELRA